MSDQAKTASLMALALHYPKSSRTDREQALWLSDYLSDLRGHSAEAVNAACTSYRQTAAKSFPKVGELLPLANAVSPRDVFDQGGAWAPLGDTDYQALSLRDKIRYHRIAANEAGRTAGPMWKNGRAAKPEELGEKWARFTKVKANHLAEVRRLRKIMDEYEERVRPVIVSSKDIAA